MPLTLLLSKVIGVGFIFLSVILIARRRYFISVMGGFVEQRLLRMVVSLFELFVGLLLIVTHNVWSPLPAAIITLIGWMAVVEALLYLCLPDEWLGRFIAAFNTSAWYVSGGSLGIAVGVYLAGSGWGFW